MYDMDRWAWTCHARDTVWGLLETLDDAQVTIRAQELCDAPFGPAGRTPCRTAHRRDISRPLLPFVATLGAQESDEALCHTYQLVILRAINGGAQAVTESGSTSSSSLYRLRIVTSETSATSLTSFCVTFSLVNRAAA